MRRDTHNFFNKRAAHFVDTKNRLPSSWLEFQLSRSEFKSQLTVFFFNSKIISAFGHDVIHVPSCISYLGFLLWRLWLSHSPRVRVNTYTQCVHLTNPCTKQKVLSLTKPKGKIYKTKSLRNYMTQKRLAISKKGFEVHGDENERKTLRIILINEIFINFSYNDYRTACWYCKSFGDWSHRRYSMDKVIEGIRWSKS